MQQLRVDNYIITTPIIEILQKLRMTLANGKLREIKPGSENIVVTCPHHAGGHETHAACNVYAGHDDKIAYGQFHCFACGCKGSFVKFVQECFESSEDFAKQWLKTNFGTLVESVLEIEDPIDLGLSRLMRGSSWPPIDPHTLDEYQSWCPYLGERKLSREVCELFNVKYDPKKRRIIFPCYNVNGDLIMLPSRAIDTKTFYIDKNLEKPVYCLDYLIRNNYKKAIITEGPIDTLTAYTYGYPACGTLGMISDKQIERLNRSPLTTLYAMFDNDMAGEKIYQYLKKRLSKRILLTKIPIPNGKKDINDLNRDEFINVVETYKNS